MVVRPGFHGLLVVLLLGATCSDRLVLTVPELPLEEGFLGLVYRGPEDPWIGTGLRRYAGPPLELDVVEPGPEYTELSLISDGG